MAAAGLRVAVVGLALATGSPAMVVPGVAADSIAATARMAENSVAVAPAADSWPPRVFQSPGH